MRADFASKIRKEKALIAVNRFNAVFGVVGEHCSNRRRCIVRSAGGTTRAYADTSSEKQGEKPCRRKPQVSCSQVNLLRVSRLLRRGREA